MVVLGKMEILQLFLINHEKVQPLIGAETELINLYDLQYRGCISCFSCKRIGGKSYGKCAVNDELTPILKK